MKLRAVSGNQADSVGGNLVKNSFAKEFGKRTRVAAWASRACDWDYGQRKGIAIQSAQIS